MCRQLELHTPCQAICDALMGMIFGVWGSKHEPRPIREKDVMAIKGNKESWLRCAFLLLLQAAKYVQWVWHVFDHYNTVELCHCSLCMERVLQ